MPRGAPIRGVRPLTNRMREYCEEKLPQCVLCGEDIWPEHAQVQRPTWLAHMECVAREAVRRKREGGTLKQPPETKTPWDFKSWRAALPKEGVVVATGHRRKGKSRDVWGMVEALHDSKGIPVVCYRFPKRLRRLLPDWVKHAGTLRDLQVPVPHIVVADEMARQAHARDHATTENREWTALMAIVAQYHHLMFCIYQHSRQMDVELAMDGDLMMFKPPSELHVRFGRPELRPEIQEAIDLFRAVKRGDPRGWVYFVDWHDGKRGFVRGPRPASFWTEELSTAYALATALEVQQQPKRKKAA